MVGNFINKTKYTKLKGLSACGLIEESFPAQQLYKFVHGISINIKVESKGESEILFSAFEDYLLYWCGVRMGLVMINSIVVFTVDLKFVFPQLLICERQSNLPAQFAVHGYAVQVNHHITEAIDRNDREWEVIYAMYAIYRLAMMPAVIGEPWFKYTMLQTQEHLERFHFQRMIDFAELLGQSISAFCIHDQDLPRCN